MQALGIVGGDGGASRLCEVAGGDSNRDVGRIDDLRRAIAAVPGDGDAGNEVTAGQCQERIVRSMCDGSCRAGGKEAALFTWSSSGTTAAPRSR